MKTVHVSASREYDIYIGAGLLFSAGEYLRRFAGPCRVCIVSDDIVFPLYGDKVTESLKDNGFEVCSYVFPNGEKQKNLETYGGILEYLSGRRFSRSDMIVALGGGVTGDIAGFAAATYQRGIPYVQIPTTLLAMVDSSVGGKTAVDLESGKNQVGCFYQPAFVLCDTDTLGSLPDDQIRCGCAEIIKYAMIEDNGLFGEIEKENIRNQYEHVIETCVHIKSDIVHRDEFDTGVRQFLNFGHTVGHAVEVLSDFSVTHGEAVAIGMAYITSVAVNRGICDAYVRDSLVKMLEYYSLPASVDFSTDEITDVIHTDKKIRNGRLSFIVPEKIGVCRIEEISSENIKEFLESGKQ